MQSDDLTQANIDAYESFAAKIAEARSQMQYYDVDASPWPTNAAAKRYIVSAASEDESHHAAQSLGAWMLAMAFVGGMLAYRVAELLHQLLRGVKWAM